MNAISEEEAYRVKGSLDQVIMPMIQVWEALTKAIRPRGIRPEAGHGIFNEFQEEFKRHTIQECQEFQAEIQELIDQGKLKFCEKKAIKEVNMVNDNPPNPKVVRPLTIFYKEKTKPESRFGERPSPRS